MWPSHKLTAKQEAFCQAIIAGKSQADAYREAYDAQKMKPESIHRMACELAKNLKVTSRLEELREVVVQDLKYEVEDAMREAKQAIRLAVQEGQAGAYVQAVALRAKLSGLLTDKHEHRYGPLDDEPTQVLLEIKALVQERRQQRASAVDVKVS